MSLSASSLMLERMRWRATRRSLEGWGWGWVDEWVGEW